MGRKFGLNKYGRYTYDKGAISWIEVTIPGGIEIWDPLPASPPSPWLSDSVPPASEIWVPSPATWPPPPENWGSATTTRAEIWVPIKPPLVG